MIWKCEVWQPLLHKNVKSGGHYCIHNWVQMSMENLIKKYIIVPALTTNFWLVWQRNPWPSSSCANTRSRSSNKCLMYDLLMIPHLTLTMNSRETVLHTDSLTWRIYLHHFRRPTCVRKVRNILKRPELKLIRVWFWYLFGKTLVFIDLDVCSKIFESDFNWFLFGLLIVNRTNRAFNKKLNFIVWRSLRLDRDTCNCPIQY